MNSVRPDAKLVCASIKGELLAFEELVGRYQNVIYRDVLRYMREAEEAQDVVQETFLRAFQELSKLRDPRKFGPWLRSVARHCCLNALRSRGRAFAARDKLKEDLVESTYVDPTVRPIEEEDVSFVRDLLSRLPAETAQVVVMHYMEAVPVAIIARRLSCSPQAIKQRLYRARKQLHEEVLEIMKDDFEREQLPEGFASRVIANLLEAGRKDMLYMRYDRARARFQEAVDAAPEDPETLLELGRSYDPIGWPSSKDVEMLERAAAVAPASLPVMCALEVAYRQPGFEGTHEEVLQKCSDLCDKRLAETSKDVQALRHKAELLRGIKDYAGAEELLRVAVAEAPEDQVAQYFLALIIGNQGRYDEACPLYERTYDLNPKTQWGYFALRQLATHLVFRKVEGKKAVALMEEVWMLTQAPREASNLIYFYSATEQLKEALSLFESVAYPRHHARVLVTVGVGYSQRGDREKAQEALRSAMELTKDDGLRREAQVHLAEVLFAREQTEEAREVLEEGLKLDVEERASLAGRRTSAFWRPWTKWLAEVLEGLAEKDARVVPLLCAVREDLGQGSVE